MYSHYVVERASLVILLVDHCIMGNRIRQLCGFARFPARASRCSCPYSHNGRDGYVIWGLLHVPWAQNVASRTEQCNCLGDRARH